MVITRSTCFVLVSLLLAGPSRRADASPFLFDLRVNEAFYNKIDWQLDGTFTDGEAFSGDFSFDRRTGVYEPGARVTIGQTEFRPQVPYSPSMRANFLTFIPSASSSNDTIIFFQVSYRPTFVEPGVSAPIYTGSGNGDLQVVYADRTRFPTLVKEPSGGALRSSSPSRFILISSLQGNEPEVVDANKYKAGFDETSRMVGGISDHITTVVPLGETNKEEIAAAALDNTVNIVDKLQKTASLAGAAASMAKEVFAIGAKTATLGASVNYARIAADPPSADFLVEVQPSGAKLNLGFGQRFGIDYGDIDAAFESFGAGVENYERFVITLERLQGALIADNRTGIDLQLAVGATILRDIDDNFNDASERFSVLANTHGADDPEFADLAMQLSSVADQARTSAVIQSIPEPASGLLALAAGVGLTAFRRPHSLRRPLRKTCDELTALGIRDGRENVTGSLMGGAGSPFTNLFPFPSPNAPPLRGDRAGHPDSPV